MRCPNCNEEIKDTAKWCGYCGHKIEEPSSVPEEPAPEVAIEAVEEVKPVDPSPITKEIEKKPELKPIAQAPVEEVPVETTLAAKTKKVKKSAPKPTSASARKNPVKAKKKSKKQKKVPSSAVVKEKKVKPKKKIKIPVWTWILLVVAIVVIAAVVFIKPPQDIAFSRACLGAVFAEPNRPMSITYGYWGYLNDFRYENEDAVYFKIYIDGNPYTSTEKTKVVKRSEVPCKAESSDFLWDEKSSWMFDSIEIDGLPPGNYKVEVLYYSEYEVMDGLRNDNGFLITYGPGLIFKEDFRLVVQH
jgi:hypothetical protein